MSRSRSKSQGFTLADLTAAVSAGQVAPLYLFLGPERFLRREAIALLTETVDEAFRAFNIDSFSIAEHDLETAFDVARQLPMMSPRRLVVLHDADAIREGSQESLENYLKSPVDSAVVVFIADALDQRRKTSTALAKACTTVRFDTYSEAEAVRWTEARVRQLGGRIDRAALGALVDLAGTELTRLSVEIEKLASHAGTGAIDLASVRQLVTRSREHQVWDLTDAILARDRARAIRVVVRQLDSGEEPLGLLGMLASTYRKMLVAKELMSRKAPAAEVQAAVKLPPWKMSEFNAQVRHVETGAIVRAIRRMDEVDAAIKSSVGTPRLQLEILVCELTL